MKSQALVSLQKKIILSSVAAVFDCVGFNDKSTPVGPFVSPHREREKRDRRDSRGDEREEQGRRRNRNESEETKEIKHCPSTLTHYKNSRPCPTVSQYQFVCLC